MTEAEIRASLTERQATTPGLHWCFGSRDHQGEIDQDLRVRIVRNRRFREISFSPKEWEHADMSLWLRSGVDAMDAFFRSETGPAPQADGGGD